MRRCAISASAISFILLVLRLAAAACTLFQEDFINGEEKNTILLHFVERSLTEGLSAEKTAHGLFVGGAGMCITDQMKRITFCADCVQDMILSHSAFLTEVAGSILSGTLTPETALQRLEHLGLNPRKFYILSNAADVDQTFHAAQVAAQKTDIPMLSWVLQTYGKFIRTRISERSNSASVPLGARALMGADTDGLCWGGTANRRAMSRIRDAVRLWDGKGAFADFVESEFLSGDSSASSVILDEEEKRAIEREVKRQRGTGWGLKPAKSLPPVSAGGVNMQLEEKQKEEEGEGEMGTLYESRVLAFERLVEHFGTGVFPALDSLVDLGRVDAVDFLLRAYTIDLSTPLTDNLEDILEAERAEGKEGQEGGEKEVCGICHAAIVHPVTLECNGRHTFCSVCLRRVRYPSADRPYVPCPMCREEVWFPYGYKSMSDRQAKSLREWITREGGASTNPADEQSDEEECDPSTRHQSKAERPPLWWARKWWEEKGRL
uniref:RING-type domain-containing protein n=1 Tax=Chromera velia CCMP2878 TaxID=1169474 RepID=A0A0G4F3C2_9ALVE|eukprot:Cvel_14750.t1-p1 / transcript=Cvel_14750.t1 / gene=Cvel_14750 / organism=Chromera_velia_CCMP2878 / gene_product=hypothetical protein / transcript_product=hypothetical protein / location=Cvel_scaffold1061:36181-38089(+) / protein_length=492 / sequence_SO=supercontig / SO=protein_coding / is_pseudo=false